MAGDARPQVPGRFRATVERVTEWNAITRSIFLRVPAATPLRFTPGQFLSIDVPSGGERALTRAYSIASSPARAELLEICVDVVQGGPGSAWLFGLAPGAPVDFKAPFGSFTVTDPPD